jgi:hypothetical protein
MCLTVPDPRKRSISFSSLLILNLIPPILFASRFVPHGSIGVWNRLLAGTEDQRKVIDRILPGKLRVLDLAPVEFWKLFPQNFAHLYSIHTVHGYSALQVPTYSLVPDADPRSVSDYTYTTNAMCVGSLSKVGNEAISRFFWPDQRERQVAIKSESLNSVEVEFSAGKQAILRRTDTFYPGWSAILADGTRLPIVQTNAFCSEVLVPPGITAIRFVYRPNHLWLAIAFALSGIALLAVAEGILFVQVGGRKQS